MEVLIHLGPNLSWELLEVEEEFLLISLYSELRTTHSDSNRKVSAIKTRSTKAEQD